MWCLCAVKGPNGLLLLDLTQEQNLCISSGSFPSLPALAINQLC